MTSHRGLALALGFGMAALLLAGAEWAARRWGDVAERPALFSDPELRTRERPFVAPDAVLGFRLKPNYASEALHTDASGFRSAAADDVTADATILAVGDSTTFGWSVRDEETYPAQLEHLLNGSAPSRHVRVINAGVPSYTSAQVYRSVRQLLEQRVPSVVIVSVLWNDLWFSTVQNWYPEILVFARPSPLRAYLAENSALYRRLVSLRAAARPGRDLPNADAHDYYVDEVRRTILLAGDRGAGAIFLVPPFDESRVGPLGIDALGQNSLSKDFFIDTAKSWARDAMDAAASAGAIVVDHPVSLFRPPHPALFSDLIHPNAWGYELIAEALARPAEELIRIPPRAASPTRRRQILRRGARRLRRETARSRELRA